MNYYETLGIDKKSTQETIKKAYKTKAGKLHPDKGGNHNDFVKLNEAYSVLSDKKKRKHYDEHGSYDANQPTIEQAADAHLNALFEAFVDKLASLPNFDLSINIVHKMECHIKDNIIELERKKDHIIKHNRKFRKIQKRLISKNKGENSFSNILKNKRMNGIHEFQSIKIQINLFNLMLEKLENYEFETEASQVYMRNPSGLSGFTYNVQI